MATEKKETPSLARLKGSAEQTRRADWSGLHMRRTDWSALRMRRKVMARSTSLSSALTPILSVELHPLGNTTLIMVGKRPSVQTWRLAEPSSVTQAL